MYRISTFIFGGLLFFALSCGSSDDKSAQNAAAAKNADSKLVPDGMAIFRQKCITCHGADGTLGLNGAKDLTQSALSLEERVNIITNGKNLMTPFGTLLNKEEIQAVAEFTQSLKK